MDPFYPRIMARWNGIPSELDAAISVPKGSTMFFKGNDYWEFDDKKTEPKKGFPKSVEGLFDYCTE